MYSDRTPKVWETVMTVLLAATITFCFLFSCLGCKTTRCPECVPEIQTQTVEVPVRYCEPPPEIQVLNLPPWPTLPDNPTEDQLKEWYARCVSTYEAREKILMERYELYRKILEEYAE
jgi:hypothetical protein